jgi:uncharacterized protein (DUF1501 family)
MMNRRLALQSLWGAAASGWGWGAMAAPSTEQRLVVVFLRGAYDAANVLVQHGSDFYYQSRPNISVPQPGRTAEAALRLTDAWALHPALADSMYPLWQAGELAFVPFSGLASASRSHFEMQDRLESGLPASSAPRTDSGFLNRLAAELAPARVVSFTSAVPTVVRGKLRVPNVDLQRFANDNLSPRETAALLKMYEGTPLEGTVRETFEVRSTVSEELKSEMQQASRGAISPRGFGLVAQRMGRLMREQYRIGFADIGQWDTHVNQGNATGTLADRLRELGGGLAALRDELGPAWDKTTVVVMSEFGRTFRENGNRGTDHGSGSALWVLGGQVRGGQVLGEQPLMTRERLNEDRDWPVLNDYRAVLGGLFGQRYGMDAAAVGRVFPGAGGPSLKLA